VFPQTPPDSASPNSHLRPTSNEWEFDSTTSRADPSPPPPLPDDAAKPPTELSTGPRAVAHARAYSLSTADEHTATSHSNETGTFKVVIERAPFGRPKTADTASFPLLQVPIPTYKLGTPHFSTRGTADLRSSVYTGASGAEDLASSLLSPPGGTHSFVSSRPRSDAYSPVPRRYRATMDRPPLPSSAPSSSRVSQLPIGPRLYDALTVNPDDRAVVRFSSNGDILAAIPSRLIAHITSPSFLDYELLSDFFLTFRAFLCTRDLAAYLISRLRWAVDRQDYFGRIVRVRTFVALRHWILNYFMDDFVPFYKLRTYFCDLVNSLYTDLRNREDGGGGDVKIVGELKRCWRRTCALYWESDDGITRGFVEDDLLPGGQVDSRASLEEPVHNPLTPNTTRRPGHRDTKETSGSNPSDQFASRHMDWAQRARHTPQNSLSSPYVPSHDYETSPVPLSPASEQSMHVLSCSIPVRGLGKSQPVVDLPLYPHPVPAGTARLPASPQQPVSAKPINRPSHAHKRSGSFSDALRDSRAPLSNPKYPTAETAASVVSNMPGSLVRGGLFQPGSPYIEVRSLRHARSQAQLELDDTIGHEPERSTHQGSPGMKKIFGSVRRALSTRQPLGASPQIGNVGQYRQPGSSRASNLGNISTVSGGIHTRRTERARPQMRIDLLASQVAESFKEAVKQQLRNEDQLQLGSEPPELGGFEFEFDRRNTPLSDQRDGSGRKPDPRIQSAITTGSKSILIIDDTGAPPVPTLSGGLPAEVEQAPEETSSPYPFQRGISIDEHTNAGNLDTAAPSELYDVQVPVEKKDYPTSPSSARRPPARQRRSMSDSREHMHSFRRCGSTKNSIARSSLRRHASYNSVLSRRRGPDSVATFQTMSSNNDPFFLDQHPNEEATAPTRQLRRRPGGDLRAAGNVQNFEHIQRPHSTGSVSNRTHSVTNSVILRSDRFVHPSAEPTPQAEHGEAEEISKKRISLVSTHSSQPNLRPSFEVEVAKLAALPDDTDDEGGVESALRKLEGRYEMTSPSTSSSRDTVEPEFYEPNDPSDNVSEHSLISSLHHTDDLQRASASQDHRSSADNLHRRLAVGSVGESEDSYSSVPLLDRGLSSFTAPQRGGTLDTMRSSAKPSPLQLASTLTPQATHIPDVTTSPHSSLEYVVETDSMKRIPQGATRPVPSATRQSFLLDEDEDLSDVETIGGRSDGTSHGVRSFFDDEPATIEHAPEDLPSHPMRHLPTPPLTADRLKAPGTESTVFQRGLPTPGLSPTASRPDNQAFSHFAQLSDSPVEAPAQQPLKSSAPSAHMPFVLAYDSEVLAQQFTVVEKDALDEIDWKELVELRWKQSSPQIRDWVQYLRSEEARGVDVVIARFNLVVKWVASECVLTEDLHERARCIIKYIHIATHARRLRNYATMYQITIALLSNDVSRLRQTWALVPPVEMHVMKELEAIVQPLRNFHNLRLEMETATVEEGCIPFIGIYTRDLIYNAQKPAFIDAPPVDGERLVNFERHHTAAMIVKNLLRLLEASSKYAFEVVPQVVSKCLWLAALSDEEITRRSRLCE
jgi:hypothetical protein